MSLSLEKILEMSPEGLELDLIRESWRPLSSQDQETQAPLEQTWGPLLFLKAIGFQKIRFIGPTEKSLRNWQARVEIYQQEFIHDPEYLQVELCQWNESADQAENSAPLIECSPRLETRPLRQQSKSKPRVVVSKMAGPLKQASVSMKNFVEEARSYEAKDTLRRMQAILREFKNEKKDSLHEEWNHLVGSVFRIALETKNLSVAEELLQTYREELLQFWSDAPRLRSHLQAYEASSGHFHRWTALFDGIPLAQLIPLLETELSMGAGPQIIKLMTHRAEREHESLIELSAQLKPSSQKILLQWLAPYWRPKHYPIALRSLQKILQDEKDLELIQSWVQAMLQSYRAQALADLKKLFTQPIPGWRRFFGRGAQPNKALRFIIKALAENPSTEILQFLKELKPQLKGEAADEADRVIQNFRYSRITSP